MKKINLLVIAFLFGAMAVNANPVDVTVAQKVAANFYSSNYSASNPSPSLTYTEKDASGVPVYYVFNINTTQGFVIVTAEDAAHPIIGYSNNGSFVIPAADNNNIHYWLQQRKNEVIAMRAHNIAATSDITAEWASYSTANSSRAMHASIVAPLCKTSWDQSPYYNAMCPGGSVTGCVATAMAQIMKYWGYPSIGTGSNCYDDATSQGYSENYGELCATFDTSHYKWSAMPNSVVTNNTQVAKLMYDCGVSVDMDYTPTGSGAEVIGWAPSAYNSYTAYFGYDASTINVANYNSSQQASFNSILFNELNNRRPVQFQGTDPSEGGHSWVCDGYDSALATFHMNWGWSGQDDGYYAISALTPSGFDFSQYIGVIYGIEPPPGFLAVQKIADNSTVISVYPNPSHGVFNFTMPTKSTYMVSIYNVLGQEVNTSVISSTNNTINLSNQPKGVYIYKLATETGSPVSTGRVVVE